jgi:7,8-dihydro-6-hydroxymethylpterin dimethyltransferase
VLREDGILIATTRNEVRAQPPREDAAERSRNYVRQHWKYTESDISTAESCCGSGYACTPDSFSGFLDRLQTYSLCISGMSFQDAWNVDIERLQRCCVHVATAKDKLIPFCSYYLTDSKGRRFIDRDGAHLLK